MDAPTGLGLGLGAGPPIPGQRSRPWLGDYFGSQPPYLAALTACPGYAATGGTNNGGCGGGSECIAGACQPVTPCASNTDCIMGQGCAADGQCHTLDLGPCAPTAACSTNPDGSIRSIPFSGAACVAGECVVVGFLNGAPPPVVTPTSASLAIGVVGALLLGAAAYASTRGGRL